MSQSKECNEQITPGPAQDLAGLLGVPLPDVTAAGGPPFLWHSVYLLPRHARADLGPDGHPVVGAIPSPPRPGQRRMFAGGRVQTTGHLRYGEPASRHIFVRNSTEKRGGSGRLTFVTVAHEISQAGQVVIAEEQDIVYRDAATAKHQGSTSRPNRPESARSEASAPVEANEWQIDVDPVLLFGFSALTHNSHRIHYDREYAREVEGYPALVVHGPLQTILMAEGARRLNPTLARPTRFEYRMVSPLFDHEGLVVSAVATRDGIDTVSRAADGRITALGTLIFSA